MSSHNNYDLCDDYLYNNRTPRSRLDPDQGIAEEPPSAENTPTYSTWEYDEVIGNIAPVQRIPSPEPQLSAEYLEINRQAVERNRDVSEAIERTTHDSFTQSIKFRAEQVRKAMAAMKRLDSYKFPPAWTLHSRIMCTKYKDLLEEYYRIATSIERCVTLRLNDFRRGIVDMDRPTAWEEFEMLNELEDTLKTEKDGDDMKVMNEFLDHMAWEIDDDVRKKEGGEIDAAWDKQPVAELPHTLNYIISITPSFSERHKELMERERLHFPGRYGNLDTDMDKTSDVDDLVGRKKAKVAPKGIRIRWKKSSK